MAWECKAGRAVGKGGIKVVRVAAEGAGAAAERSRPEVVDAPGFATGLVEDDLIAARHAQGMNFECGNIAGNHVVD